MPIICASRRALTPLIRAAQQVHRDNLPDAPRPKRKGGQPAVPPPEFGPPIYDPETLSEGLLYAREHAYALCMGLRFERWLLFHVAEKGIPLDNCMAVVTLLPIYVEAFLVAAVTWPLRYAPPVIEDEPDDLPTWSTEAAPEDGLTIVLPTKRDKPKPAPSLPGCQGDDNGAPCLNLRRYGERFCPPCRRKELERMRAEVC